MKTILVTGGAGYIGSHAVLELIKNYNVIVIDNLENGNIELIDRRAKLYIGNLCDKNFLINIFENNKIDIVMHFAAYIKVSESIENPNKYYSNNIYATICLLDIMNKYNVKKIIFSSTAAVYGKVSNVSIVDENYPTLPINPYGHSKLIAEEIIKENSNLLGLKYVIFRYFNVAGAHKSCLSGQNDKESTALIPNILKAVSQDKEVFIYGNTYNTIDGTGVRDFIHVSDIVDAHIKAIDFLEENKSETFNLGSENGFSVLEVIKTTEKVINKKIKYLIKERREGDPDKVITTNLKAKKMLNWEPNYNLKDIILTAWKWKIKNN